jgi:hypothetical protein
MNPKARTWLFAADIEMSANRPPGFKKSKLDPPELATKLEVT